jgi:hypothetical protein
MTSAQARAKPVQALALGTSAWHAPAAACAFACRCGAAVDFSSSACAACQTPLGYDSAAGTVLPLEPLLDDDLRAPVVARRGEALRLADSGNAWWRAVVTASGTAFGAAVFRRCAHLDSPAACNWLVAADDYHAGVLPLCRCCRLTRSLPVLPLPDPAAQDSALWWQRIELAKRSLVASLIGQGLPVLPKSEDPEGGLAFDLLRATPGQAPVLTGYADGVITLDIEEADDAWREQRRVALGQPCRTLLGQLRHESGHYYWQRLVAHTAWLQPCRALFGDERQDSAQALQRYARHGPAPDWDRSFVSAYASSHPAQDWADTWAAYLAIVDTLDSARGFALDNGFGAVSQAGLDLEALEALDPERAPNLGPNLGPEQAGDFLHLIDRWVALTGVLNALAHSMALRDFCPQVLSAPALRKLYMVHRVIADGAARS